MLYLNAITKFSTWILYLDAVCAPQSCTSLPLLNVVPFDVANRWCPLILYLDSIWHFPKLRKIKVQHNVPVVTTRNTSHFLVQHIKRRWRCWQCEERTPQRLEVLSVKCCCVYDEDGGCALTPSLETQTRPNNNTNRSCAVYRVVVSCDVQQCFPPTPRAIFTFTIRFVSHTTHLIFYC